MTPLLNRQIHLVTGKGGVGKSLVSCVLAHLFEQGGHKTLLVQLHAKDAHSQPMETRPITADLHQARDNLWVVNIDPAKALTEYITLKIRSEKISEALVNRPTIKQFLKFVPSMAELNMLGKIWYHAEETQGRRRRFDRVVVDCPPTGHALKFVDVARTVFSVAPGGMMGDETRRIMHTLQDPSRSCLHVVTGLEELMIKETVELIAQAEKSATAPLGYLICNGVQEPMFGPEDLQHLAQTHEDLHHDVPSPLKNALQIALNRAQAESRQGMYLNKLKGVRSNMPMLMLPLIEKAELRSPDLRELGQWLVQQVPSVKGAPS